jgi:hypothetical protein
MSAPASPCWMHAVQASAGLRCPHGDPRRRPSSSNRGYGRWVTLQHVQTPDLFLNVIQMQHLQHASERQMKHLKYASKTLTKTPKKHLKIIAKHTQLLDIMLATYVWNIYNIKINTLAKYVWKNRWNIRNRSLQQTCTTIATYATSRSTFAISIWNTCNIPLTTYAFSKTSQVGGRSTAQRDLVLGRGGGGW